MSTSNSKTKKLSNLQKLDRRNVFRASAIVTVLLLLLSILSPFVKDREYSENENRYLAGRPALSPASVADGSYMADMESYLSDQFIGRDALVRTRSDIDLFVGKRDLNGVYVGKDHFLFEKTAACDQARLTKTLDAIRGVAAQNPSLKQYIALAPNAAELLPDKLPANAPTEDQTAQIRSIYQELQPVRSIDLVTPLKAVEDPATLYYKTDHHWTTAAAEVAVRQMIQDMGFDPGTVRYRKLPVTNAFQGTMASTSGVFRTQDTISVAIPDPEVRTLVTYVEEGRKSASLFDSSKLKEKDKYEVFFGGNYGKIRIETNADSDRVLLLVKDSYANCAVSMLTPYFKTIIMVDPRYFNDSLADTISGEGVTDLLWFYNLNTFLQDTSIADKLG